MSRGRAAPAALLAMALAGLAACAGDRADAVGIAATPATGPRPSQTSRLEAATAPEPAMSEPPMMTGRGATRGRCDAEAARPAALGQPATPEVVEQARRDAGASLVRVLRPGQVVTMEFVAGRLDIDVDEGNTIVGLRCG